MATGFEEWLFGYAGTKVADRVLALLRGDPPTADLDNVVEKWADSLPAEAALASSSALFPSHVPDAGLQGRPKLARLRAELEHSRVPTVDAWKQALLEQWLYIRTNIANPRAFFLLSESEASDHIDQLAARLGTVCAQYEPLFRATTITLLRELLAQSDAAKIEQPIASVRQTIRKHC